MQSYSQSFKQSHSRARPRRVKARCHPPLPVNAWTRWLAPECLHTSRQEFDHMLELGIIRPTSSNWSSPLNKVPKRSSNWSICGDYRALNNSSVPDCYPTPHIQDFSASLHVTTIFSQIDLVTAYYQIPVEPADIPDTAITITHQ